MAGDERLVDGGFLRFLLPAVKKTPGPGPCSPPELLAPPHCLVAPPPPPLPQPCPDERLFIVVPTRPSWLPPPPPPRLPAPRPAFPAGAGPRPRNASRFGGRNGPIGRKVGNFIGNGGRAGFVRRKVGGGLVGAANGDEAAAETTRAIRRAAVAQRDKKVWVAVEKKVENGGELVDQAAAGAGYAGGDEAEGSLVAEDHSEPGDDDDDLFGEELAESLVVAGDHGCHDDTDAGGKPPSEALEHLAPQSNATPRLRARPRKQWVECRNDINTFTSCLLSLYDSVKPSEEQRSKQRQLVDSLAKSVSKEWPNAQLHLYGSCANSFGTSHSDVDVCLEIEISGTQTVADVLLRLAEVLQANNFDGVEAITSARVPIVRMLDPESGFSCDICINNLFAVANTNLLRYYAQIDDRLLQLASIVKHWAKLRSINETYRGTLSSYAYVLMCISFLQLREPKILPCLQAMEPTYTMVVDDTECAFFDKVGSLHEFGAENKESIAELLWAFFHYWAFHHDYRNDVVSVRMGKIISKKEKNWTTRVRNDRHLMCIEDPFEITHDLGRVVDRQTIRIIREEFERAAGILQYDNNPCETLFEPYNYQP